MAKIKTLRYELGGENYEINVNCTSKGVFTCEVPMRMQELLDIVHERLNYSSLRSLEEYIHNKVKAYKEGTKEYKLLLAIFYQVSGRLCEDEEGNKLTKRVTQQNVSGTSYYSISKHDFSASFCTAKNVISLDWDVVIERVIDGKSTKFYANRIDREKFPEDYEGAEGSIKGWRCSSQWHKEKDVVLIPYTPEAEATLENITEQLRRASAFIYELVSQEPDVVEILLTQGVTKLLQ